MIVFIFLFNFKKKNHQKISLCLLYPFIKKSIERKIDIKKFEKMKKKDF